MSEPDDPNDVIPSTSDGSVMEKLEAAKRVSDRGTDYWRAREICPVLGYEWRRFEDVVQRAMTACSGVGMVEAHHFARAGKKVDLGSGATRQVPDYFLTRGACYLVAMNGDPAKSEIAAAQTYFTVQTRRMEIRDSQDAALTDDAKRLELRDKVSGSARRVSGVAKEAGVLNAHQGIFHEQRYLGMYEASSVQVKKAKGLSRDDNLFDRAGPLELSAHDFQMNLASDIISKENTRGEQAAIKKNLEVARHVRKTIRDSGGTLPEALPLAEHIADVRKRVTGRRTKMLPKP